MVDLDPPFRDAFSTPFMESCIRDSTNTSFWLAKPLNV